MLGGILEIEIMVCNEDSSWHTTISDELTPHVPDVLDNSRAHQEYGFSLSQQHAKIRVPKDTFPRARYKIWKRYYKELIVAGCTEREVGT